SQETITVQATRQCVRNKVLWIKVGDLASYLDWESYRVEKRNRFYARSTAFDRFPKFLLANSNGGQNSEARNYYSSLLPASHIFYVNFNLRGFARGLTNKGAAPVIEIAYA